jgi:hypothetical protein
MFGKRRKGSPPTAEAQDALTQAHNAAEQTKALQEEAKGVTKQLITNRETNGFADLIEALYKRAR